MFPSASTLLRAAIVVIATTTSSLSALAADPAKSLYERLGGKPALTALAEDTVKALDKFSVPAAEQGEVMNLLGGLKGDVVNR